MSCCCVDLWFVPRCMSISILIHRCWGGSGNIRWTAAGTAMSVCSQDKGGASCPLEWHGSGGIWQCPVILEDCSVSGRLVWPHDDGSPDVLEVLPRCCVVIVWRVKCLSWTYMDAMPCDTIFFDVPVVLLGWLWIWRRCFGVWCFWHFFLIISDNLCSFPLVGLDEVGVQCGASASDVVQCLSCSL